MTTRVSIDPHDPLSGTATEEDNGGRQTVALKRGLDIPNGMNDLNGEPGGIRTRDHRIKSAMLYQLSYRPMLFYVTEAGAYRLQLCCAGLLPLLV